MLSVQNNFATIISFHSKQWLESVVKFLLCAVNNVEWHDHVQILFGDMKYSFHFSLFQLLFLPYCSYYYFYALIFSILSSFFEQSMVVSANGLVSECATKNVVEVLNSEHVDAQIQVQLMVEKIVQVVKQKQGHATPTGALVSKELIHLRPMFSVNSFATQFI